jgi:integrase
MHDENWQGEWIGDRVKIIKRPKRRPYYAQYTDNKGQRHLPSLKTANIKAARKRAHELLSALENMTDARLDRVKDNQRVTFGEAAEIYLEECELAEKSRKEDRTRLDIVRKDWEDVPINTITTGHIESWLAKNRNKRQWSKSTRNRYLSAIKQVFKKAFSLDYAMENVASPIKALKEDEKIPDPLSDDVMTALMEVLPEYAKYYVAILVDTGLRRGELARIRWRDVDTQNKLLTVPTTKNRTFKVVPMTNRIAGLFDSLRPGRTWAQTQSGHSNHTIAWPDDSNPDSLVLGEIDLKKSLIAAAKKIGVDHIHPHQFRHTFATRLMRRGIPMEHIMALGGWKTASMAKRYARVNPVELRQQIEALEELPGYQMSTETRPTS